MKAGMVRLVRWLVRHHRSLAVLSVLLGIFAFHFTVLLYKNLRTGIEELLPKNARSVVDLDKTTHRLESSSSLAILISSDHVAESKRFVIELARKLDQLRATGLVARVEYRIDQERDFFQKRRALFLDIGDLRRIRNFIQDKITYEATLRNPLTIFQDIEIPEPNLDIGTMEKKYARQISILSNFPDGFYATPDQRTRAILVYITGQASGINNALKVRALVDQAIQDLNPRSFAPDLTIHFTGDVQNLIEENNSLLRDLELSAIIVPVLVLLAMVIYFRDWLSTLALIFSLLIGASVGLGISYFAIGYLNANSAFLGSIVVGNGINFGIILLARYLEERRRGIAHEAAIQIACSRTGLATLIASLAAGLAYGSLVATQFRGFRQFGIIGLIGMICCWTSSYTILPVYLTVAENFRPFTRRRPVVQLFRFSGLVSWIVSRFPALVLGFSALVSAGALFSVFHGPRSLLETDTTQLRDKKSLESGSGYYSRYLDEIFQRWISPVVILPRSAAHASEIATRLKAEKAKQGPNSDLAAVYSINDLVPKHQRAKIEILRQIRGNLTPAILSKLPPRDRELARNILQKANFTPFSEKDLPEQTKARFRETDGTIGKLVLVEPRFEPQISLNGAYQLRFINTIRRITDSVEPGAPVVGQLPLTVDMQQSIRRDGPLATAIAATAVTILVLVLFRNPLPASLVLLSLLLGVGWLAAIIFHWDLKINFLNFIAIPITFGIAVDYPINVIQRYRSEGRGGIIKALRTTGGAVALASLTTIIGYGSLLIAGNRGFVSFGRIAIIGEMTCIFTTLLTLPALIFIADSRWRRLPQTVHSEQEKDLEKAA